MTTTNHDELLVRIDERVRVILEELNNLELELHAHDRRIHSLEKWRWRIGGALGLLAIIISVVGGRIIFF